MKQSELEARYRQLMERRAADRTRCPAPEALLALAERRGPKAERVGRLNHVMACSACREELDLLRAIVAARPRPRVGLAPMAVAAGLALIIGAGAIWQAARDRQASPDVMRGAVESLTAVAPAADWPAERPIIFTWRSAEGAIAYRLELVDGVGDSVWEGTVGDTVLALPAGIALQPGQTYSWWVEARLADGTSRTSTVISFTIAP